MSTQTNLAKAFDARKSFFAHRASTVFPLRLRAKADLHIIFLNYWLLKNGIEEIGINFRIYDVSGNLIARQALEAIALHNQVSVRDAIVQPNGGGIPFDGMIEVEVVSAANIAFPFPAILGVYEADGRFSAVHAAGRIKNADEAKYATRTEESNWSCCFEKMGNSQEFSVVPFFHYFIGATPPTEDESIIVTLRDANGVMLETKCIAVSGMLPFSSRLFLADEIFKLAALPPAGSFMSVALRSVDVFPRLVVGNLHKEIDFLEVTHSFPVAEFIDYCPQDDAMNQKCSYPSLLSAQTAPGLELEVRVFPTNCSGSSEVSVSRKLYSENILRSADEKFAFDSQPGSSGLAFTLTPDEEMRVLHLSGNTIPSRLNASYRYRVAGVSRRFSTDIATGAKSIVYPPKWRHWGHGCIGAGYDTYVLLRNNTHNPKSTHANTGELRIVSHAFDKKIALQVAAESCVALKLSELMDLDPNVGGPVFVSWIISMKEPVGETFWVSYHANGSVFGEHGF